MPKRVQRKRTKGWRMPPNTVYVGRPTKFGNPFKVGEYGPLDRNPIDNEGAVGFFVDMLEDNEFRGICGYPTNEEIKSLRGKNLACFCNLNEPCHADILLEMANSESTERPCES